MSTEFWIQLAIYAVSIGLFAGKVLTKLAYLEKQIDKHNGFRERVATLEAHDETNGRRLDRLEHGPQPGA